MKRILVTNDDGVRSEGIKALAEAVQPLGEVFVVAPVLESSAVGHALTLRHPLRVEKLEDHMFCVDGTPTDCVNLAIHKVLQNVPDLVLSGINKGWNLGDDITYSGTVGGALEGALLGIPSIAISQQRVGDSENFDQASSIAAWLARVVLQRGLPSRTLLNVNVPTVAAKGVRVTVQAKRSHSTGVVEMQDPRRQSYFWIEELRNEHWEPHDRSDYQAVRDGWVSVTPLEPDLTSHKALSTVEQLCMNYPDAVK